MRPSLSALLLLCATFTATLLGLGFAQSATPVCRPNMPIITLDVRYSPVQMVRRYSTAEIRKMAKNLSNTMHSGTLTGLYRGTIGLKARINQSRRTYKSGAVCTYPTRIDLSQTISRTVFIAREYPIGSCRYNAIREHEMQHVKFDEETVNAYRARLKSAVADAIRPRLTRSLDVIEVAVNGATKPVLDRLNVERRAKHARIDTPENYRRESRKCQDNKQKF